MVNSGVKINKPQYRERRQPSGKLVRILKHTTEITGEWGWKHFAICLANLLELDRDYIIDFSAVSQMDPQAATTLEEWADKLKAEMNQKVALLHIDALLDKSSMAYFWLSNSKSFQHFKSEDEALQALAV